MRISAKADYAVRAVVELAAAERDKPVTAERIATAQGIPLNLLENSSVSCVMPASCATTVRRGASGSPPRRS